ncbi:DMT family transporter [Peribacillus sp. SI8-4]|uniref:DMT family transporter n=1 Tax=Peribacillus sp. SI8-4 TaxID=3048009 RepID=UPI002554E85E|nr:DMT family transporter [Peribacillus sp. SI8-4]
MQGILFGVIAGIFISLQTVFNAQVGEKVGSWATTSLVLGLGFVSSFTMFVIMDDTSLLSIGQVNKWYLSSGVLGVVLVYCIMQAIRLLGPAYAICVVLVAQLTMAVLIDTFGWFGFAKIPFSINKLIGISIMLAGIIVFKLKKKSNTKIAKTGVLPDEAPM